MLGTINIQYYIAEVYSRAGITWGVSWISGITPSTCCPFLRSSNRGRCWGWRVSSFIVFLLVCICVSVHGSILVALLETHLILLWHLVISRSWILEANMCNKRLLHPCLTIYRSRQDCTQTYTYVCTHAVDSLLNFASTCSGFSLSAVHPGSGMQGLNGSSICILYPHPSGSHGISPLLLIQSFVASLCSQLP